jgi:hypothetical protein
MDRLIWGITGMRSGRTSAASTPAQLLTGRRRLIAISLLAILLTGLAGLTWWRPWLPPEQVLAGLVNDAVGDPTAGVRVAVPELGVAADTDSPSMSMTWASGSASASPMSNGRSPPGANGSIPTRRATTISAA